MRQDHATRPDRPRAIDPNYATFQVAEAGRLGVGVETDAAEGIIEGLSKRQSSAVFTLSNPEVLKIARGVWRDAGAIKPDAVRTSFIGVTRAVGRAEATCPKSWRHSFAALPQDAIVDPLVRQQTLGHRPTTGTGLWMTANYTHTRLETHREQIERALRRWPESLRLASDFVANESP